jgi:sec-independent protein translocase protein TatA
VFSQFGPLEIILVIVVLLLIFGPKRLPSLGRRLGTELREFKDSITSDGKRDRDDDGDQDRPALTQAEAPAPAPSAAAPEPHAADAAPDQRT